jgi:hypothetical protein
VAPDPQDLKPGYIEVQLRAGRGFQGVLRRTPGSKPAWTCRHDSHLAPGRARACAEAELERQLQGKGEVFALLHCGPCSRWWDDVADLGPLACPVCGVPMERLKLVVAGRGPAVDAGNGGL